MCVLVHSQQGCNSRGSARSKPGAQKSIQLCHTRCLLLTPRVYNSRKLASRAGSGPAFSYSSTGCSKPRLSRWAGCLSDIQSTPGISSQAQLYKCTHASSTVTPAQGEQAEAPGPSPCSTALCGEGHAWQLPPLHQVHCRDGAEQIKCDAALVLNAAWDTHWFYLAG